MIEVRSLSLSLTPLKRKGLISRLKHITFLVGAMSIFLTAQAQLSSSIYHVRYGSNEGFPDLPILSITSDGDGMMWFATEEGIIRYNGERFEALPTQGLVNPFFMLLDTDSSGQAWAISYDSKIYKLKREACQPFFDLGTLDSNQAIIQWRKVTEFDVRSENEIHIGTRLNSATIRNGLVERRNPDTPAPYGRVALRGDKLMSISNSRSTQVSGINIAFGDTIIPIPYESKATRQEAIKYSVYLANTESSFAVAAGRQLYVYADEQLHANTLTSSLTNSISFINDSTVIVGTMNEGLFVIRNGEVVSHADIHGKITCSYIDLEGAIWVGTEDNGLFYIPELEIDWLQLKNGSKDILYADSWDGKRLVISDALEIELDDQRIASPSIDIANLDAFYPRIYRNPEHLIMTLNYESQSSQVWDLHVPSGRIKPYVSVITPLHIIHSAFDTIYCTYSAIHINRMTDYVPNDRRAKRVRSSYQAEAHSSEIWMASMFGIQRARYLPDYASFDLLKSYFSEISFDQVFGVGGHLFASSRAKPLYHYNEIRDEFEELTWLDPLTVNQTLAFEQSMLLACNNGLFKLSVDDPSGNIHLEDLTSLLGIRPVKIDYLNYHGSDLMLGVDGGILQLPIRLLNATGAKPVHLILADFRVNNASVLGLDERPDIYTDFSVDVSIDLTGIKGRRQNGLAYRLLPTDTTWRKANALEFSFWHLPAQSYELQFRAGKGGFLSVPFTVKRRFYNTTWFIFLVATLVLTLIAIPLIQRQRLRSQSVRNENEQTRLRLQTLAAQLNPHFVFNALSSIQSYILNNNPRDSNDYLVKFSRHIRQALEQSKSSHTTLGQLLESTETYLNLEKMRLPDVFDYQIELDSDVRKGILLPTMLIQPFVENAVIHGMGGLHEGGKIHVGVRERSDRLLMIYVEDNGPGWAHKSNETGLGTSISFERIRLMNQLGKDRFSLQYLDASFGNGVRVEITIELYDAKN
jgi:hypothetical protein